MSDPQQEKSVSEPLTAQGIATAPESALAVERADENAPPPDPKNRVPHTPTKPLSLAQIFWYAAANLGYGAFYALNNASLGLYLEQFTHNAIVKGLMGSTHSFEGAVIQPLVGNFSDRLRTKWGRRRPFMLIFTPLSALFLLLTPACAHLPPALRLAGVILSIFLFTIFFNMAQDPYQALMPDITPEAQRGRVTGSWMLVGVIGQATLVLLPLPLNVKFGLVAAVMLVTTLLTCALIKEPSHPAEPDTGEKPLKAIGIALRGLGTLQQARKALGAIFFANIGIGAVLPLLTTFVKKITHCSDHTAEMMFLVLMLGTAVGILPFGWLVDKIGAKRVLFTGLALIAIASLNGLWITTIPQVIVVLAIAGLGNAAQSASAYPLLTSLVPAEEVGFYTGLQSTALSIATPLTAVITGELVNKGGYRVIFGVCAFGISVALLVLATMKQHHAGEEIALRNRQQGREE